MCRVSLLYSFCFSIFFFKQKTAYEMRISDWSSDVCSSDLLARRAGDADDAAMAARARRDAERVQRGGAVGDADVRMVDWGFADDACGARRDRLVDKGVPVGALALHRDEEGALRHLARVEGDALDGEVGAGGASASGGDGARGQIGRAHV